MAFFNIKDIVNFGKGRIIITIYSTLLSIVFIDYLGWAYWKYCLWYIPLNFIINYSINKKIFQKIK